MTVNQEKSEVASNKENYWVMVLSYFASFLVGLGIVAEVAANWQNIPDAVKLVGALVAMGLNVGAIWWTTKVNKPILKKVKNMGLDIPIVYITSSYEKVENIKKLDGLVDVYLPDFKYMDE
ncbi:MAG: DUF2157 domain-containing protein, partial [Alphaproteobacteria bacterium]|nr:DUF2157 domain-containing protein [Alphaproteobacteria bacterium]